MRTNSWIISRRSDGRAVLETWSPRIVAAVNLRTYQVETAYDYLARLAREVRDMDRRSSS